MSEREDDLISELQYIADTIGETNPTQRLEAQMLLCVRNYLASDAATAEKFDLRSASVEQIVRFVCRITQPRIPTMEEERAKKPGQADGEVQGKLMIRDLIISGAVALICSLAAYFLRIE